VSRIASIADWLSDRSAVEWFLFSIWLALLGLQLPVGIQNFRFSPSDVALALLTVTILFRRSGQVRAVVTRPDLAVVAVGVLMLALAWGSLVAVVRVGTLVQEAWLNKDIGVFVLACTVIAIKTLVRGPDDVRIALRVVLTAGTVVTWLGLAGDIVTAIAEGQPLASGVGRFSGFLLNPSSNGIFIAALVMLQLGSLRGRIVTWPRAVQLANCVGLVALLLATLSRSTWLALLIVLIGAVVVIARERPREAAVPFALATLIAAAAAQPFVQALSPVFDQIARGEIGRPTREVQGPIGTPAPKFSAIIGDLPVGTIRPTVAAASPASSVAPSTPTTPSTATGTPNATSTSRSTPTFAATSTATPIAVTSPSAATSATPGPAAQPTAAVAPTATPALDVAAYARSAAAIAQDRHGAADRVAIDMIALQLWFAGPSTVLAGIGLGVFFQVTPYTPIGVPVIIHNSYLWLPVEMGLPGLTALVVILLAIVSASVSVWRRVDRDLALALCGTLAVFVVWISMNEGLSQRMLWVALGLTSVVATGPGWKEPLALWRQRAAISARART